MLGPVFRAHDAQGDRLVAVKVFRLDLTPERAAELAQALQQTVALELTHPVIATPIAAGLEGTVAYLAEAYVPAESLDVALRQFGPAPFEDVLRLSAQLGGAIDFAGAVGAYHGGLHPRDVLVSTDEIRLTGFGVARALERVGVRAPVRRPYSAPERTDGGDWGRTADVYSLAAILHEVLFGRRIAGTAAQIAENITDVPGADRDKVRAAFQQALAANPGDRYATALSFASALRDASRVPHADGPLTADPEHTLQTRRRAEKIPSAAADRRERTPRTAAALPFAEPEPAPGHDASAPEPPTLVSAHVPDVPAAEAPLHPPDPEPLAHPSLSVPTESIPVEPTAAAIPALMASGMDETPASDTDLRARPPIDIVSGPASLRSSDPAPQYDLHEAGADRSRGTSPFALVAMLMLGMAIGALGGYEYATRRAADARASEVPAGATSTAGREATEVAVKDRPSATPPRPGDSAVPSAPPVAPPAAAAPRAASTPAPVAAVGPGRMLLRSTPAGAQVSVNGDERGQTPLTIRDLPYGTYTIRMTRRGYAPEQRRVALTRARPSRSVTLPLKQAGQPSRAAAPPPPATPQAFVGTLAVESRPAGAAVFLNGRRAGETPMMLSELKAGSYALRLERAGYQIWSASVSVIAGREQRVTASLEPTR